MIGVILLIQSNKNGSVQVAPLTGGNVAILDSKERELAIGKILHGFFSPTCKIGFFWENTNTKTNTYT